jgi:starch phosphorylase
MNEGHSAFLSLERIKTFIKDNNFSFAEARELVAASNVFTTHTPVPAGNDRFPRDLMEKYMKNYVESSLKISFDDFLKLGKVYPEDKNEFFCMTVLALKLSNFNNGVSKLHGHVSRSMWKDIWSDIPVDDVPITHITNGIHMNSWISKEISDLFFRYLGTRWVDAPDDHEIWKRVGEIPDIELWRTHERRRERLVDFTRRKIKKQLKDKGATQEEIDKASEVLDPEALTIGFARRFATYKRATLIFKNIERIVKILTNKTMPVQIIFAGKAHPKDDAGKEFIKQVFLMAGKEELKNRIVFLEDYDLNCAHYLVQGVDVWLNNPQRPLEASGTSGMKVNFNGGLNLSTVDGWWAEKPEADSGWSIGNGEEYNDLEYQDKVESSALYELLENHIVPLFYKRGGDDLPHEWIKKMKTSMQSLCPIFNTNRMVMEYAEKFYKPGAKQFLSFIPNNYDKLRNLARWKDKIQKKWEATRITEVIEDKKKDIKLGEEFKIKAVVHVDGLAAEDLLAEVYYGNSEVDDVLANVATLKMNLIERRDNNNFVFEANIPASSSGIVKYTIRVLPYHPELKVKFIPGYVCWA